VNAEVPLVAQDGRLFGFGQVLQNIGGFSGRLMSVEVSAYQILRGAKIIDQNWIAQVSTPASMSSVRNARADKGEERVARNQFR
jgi:hypothetical protein